jgi:hypothetical protein
MTKNYKKFEKFICPIGNNTTIYTTMGDHGISEASISLSLKPKINRRSVKFTAPIY